MKLIDQINERLKSLSEIAELIKSQNDQDKLDELNEFLVDFLGTYAHEIGCGSCDDCGNVYTNDRLYKAANDFFYCDSCHPAARIWRAA